MNKKYISKPIVVEAEQWFPGVQIEGVVYPVPNDGGDIGFHELHGEKAIWPTHYGYVIIEVGDYIATINGQRGPFPKDEFEAIYEPYDKDV